MGCNCTALKRKVTLFKRNTKRKFSIQFCLILTFGLLQKNFTTCSFRIVAKIIQNESFKDNTSSIAMSLRWFGFVVSSSEAATVIVLKKGVLKNSAKLTGKHMCWSLFSRFSCSSFLALLGEIWLRWIHQLTFVVDRLV